MQNKKVIREIENLKADTSKVIRDLTLLTSSLAEETEGVVSDTLDATKAATNDELRRIRKRLGDLRGQMRENARKADTSIHENPYKWIAGALGFGLVFGLFSRSRQR